MSFTINNSRAEAILPEGEYECIIKEAYQTVSRKGTPFIGIPLTIRTDVRENPQRGGEIFHCMWMKKSPNQADLACDGYSAKQVQMLSNAAGLPNGKKYADIDEWCEDLEGRPIRATVEHAEYRGSTSARVKWVNETFYPNVLKAKDAHAKPDDFTTVDDDDDLPF